MSRMHQLTHKHSQSERYNTQESFTNCYEVINELLDSQNTPSGPLVLDFVLA